MKRKLAIPRIGFGVLLGIACARSAPAPAPVMPIEGRWVAENTPVVYQFWPDSVEVLMYPPQAPAPPTWRRDGDTVIVSDAARVRKHGFSFRSDSLVIDWLPGPRRALSRVEPQHLTGLLGTWRMSNAREINVVTFRSDGALVAEVGVMPRYRRRADTVFVTFGQATARQLFRRVGNKIEVSNPDSPGSQRLMLVRRPWGCFGIKNIDRDARECRP